jgi:hypothetical protein
VGRIGDGEVDEILEIRDEMLLEATLTTQTQLDEIENNLSL